VRNINDIMGPNNRNSSNIGLVCMVELRRISTQKLHCMYFVWEGFVIQFPVSYIFVCLCYKHLDSLACGTYLDAN